MKRITIPITLRVQGPILTKSSSTGALGLDAVMARRKFETETGGVATHYYLPGRLVKGLVLEAWQELSTIDAAYSRLASEWLGNASPRESDDRPVRGRLAFGDFADRRTDAEAESAPRYRIAVDEVRETAAGQMMQMMESPYGSGQLVDFEGEARFVAADGEEPEGIRSALERGLLWIEAVGGTRTSGFGQLIEAKVGAATTQPAMFEASPNTPAWDLRLRFREPVVFSKRRIADNLFESGEIIPGGALRGAVAEMAGREPTAFPELLDELHAIRFSHAFPAERGGARPRQWPLSLLDFSETDVVDVVRRATPYVRTAPGAEREAIAGKFDIDWKDEVRKNVEHDYGWPKLEWELRVRTGIDSAKRKAEDERLFAWKMLLPYGIEWIARVDVSRVSKAARQQLEGLLRFGLEPLGKTKALAETTPTAAEPVAAGEGPYVVTLQTPTLLIDPGRRLAPGGKNGSAREEDLEREYQDVWQELSDGSLRLANYFQRCTLAGGQYFQRRFLGKEAQYKPYLLSSEGSTFLLEPTPGKESEARACLDGWLRSGLPLSRSVRTFYGIPDEPKIQWAHCPYVPENGYGEIAVNDRSYPEE